MQDAVMLNETAQLLDKQPFIREELGGLLIMPHHASSCMPCAPKVNFWIDGPTPTHRLGSFSVGIC